jgi:hypothetical protein
MKTLFKITIFALLMTLAFGIRGAKAHEEYTKVVKKEYPIPADGQLTISNKFGKVHINTWEKNAVSFEITVTAEAPDSKTADKILGMVDFVFNVYPTTLEAKTRFGENVNQGRSSFRVDYMVNIPSGISLNVTNKFGDVFISEITGKTKLDVSYGNLEANKLGNSDNMVEVGFGKAQISWSKGAVIVLKYSQLEIGYSGSLYLDSKFSDISSGEIISANLNAEGGEISLEKSSALKSKCKFTTLDIGKVEKSINLDIQYGSCKIHEVPSDFTSIVVTNQYADVSIGINEAANYQLDAELKYCEIQYPSEKSKFSFRSVSPTENILKGIIGSGSENPASRVQVRSSYGNISLK